MLSICARADLKEKIEKLTGTVKKVGSIQSDCGACELATAENKTEIATLMKSCVDLLCPDESLSLAAIYYKIMDRGSKPDAQYEKEIGSLVRAIALENANAKTVRGIAQLEWLKNAKSLTDPGGIRTFHLFESLTLLSKFKFKEENGKLVVDDQTSRSNLSNLSDKDFEKQVKIANILLGAYADRAIPETDPSRVQLYYPGVKFKERVNEVLGSFADKSKKIVADPELKFLVNMTEFKEITSGEKLRAQFDSSDQINPDFISELNNTNSTLNLFVSLSTNQELKKLLEAPVDIKKMSIILGTEKLIRDRIHLQKRLLDGTNEAVSNKCKIAFAMGQEALPTQKEIDAFKSRVDAIKSKFANSTQVLLCPEAAEKFRSEVDSWTASLPLTREQHAANMKASLTRTLENVKQWKAEMAEIDKSSARDTLYAIGVSSLREDYSDLTSGSDDVCKNLMPNFVPDATVWFSNKFVVGPIVVNHDNAEGISQHELGHKLFHFMRDQNICGDKNRFATMRSCLIENHGEFSDEQLLADKAKATSGGEAKYESEDWADLISTMADKKANNFACLFVRRTSIEDYGFLSLRNFDTTDPHSSDLFRLLHMNFLKTGKIPKQCEQGLAARGEKINFKNCLNP